MNENNMYAMDGNTAQAMIPQDTQIQGNMQPVLVPQGEIAPTKGAKRIKKTVYQKLLAIQVNIKAPKNLYNKYGNFKYRNAENILEAVKPYLAEQNCILILEDTIETIGKQKSVQEKDGVTVTKEEDRRYVKATAHFIDCDSGDEITAKAYANECAHNNMSEDQCTGTASSYARKYCLNGLFLLDDTKDSDSNEMNEIENAAKDNAPAPAPVRQQTRNNAPAPQQNNGWGQQGSVPAAQQSSGWGRQNQQPVQQNNQRGWGQPPQGGWGQAQ